jgi:hypothetical protein
MPEQHSRGGTHEQHVKAGQQSHKNSQTEHNPGQQGKDEQNVRAGDQSNKNNPAGGESGGSSRGGTHEQHVRAGQQSHKNS